MAEDDDIKGKVVQLLAGARKARKRRKKGPGPGSAGGAISVPGDGNVVAGRDVNINSPRVVRTTVLPPPGSVTPAEAKRIRDLIAKLVRFEVAGGVMDGDRALLYAKWHSIVKDRFLVPSYLFIPSARADEAIAWLNQVAAMNRPKLRRTDNDAWRNEHYKGIWARSRELGMSKADVYSLVLTRLEKQVTSLKQLGEQNLKRLYSIIMAMH